MHILLLLYTQTSVHNSWYQFLYHCKYYYGTKYAPSFKIKYVYNYLKIVCHSETYSTSFSSIPDKAEILIAWLLVMLAMKNGWH